MKHLIQPYLKYCKGWQAEYTVPVEKTRKVITSCSDSQAANEFFLHIKPIGRRITSMTIEEKEELFEKEGISPEQIFIPALKPETLDWLLRKEIWLFGDEYFDAGLVIEKQIKI